VLTPRKKSHLHIRIDTALLRWVRWYADMKGKTVTGVIIDLLRDERLKYEADGGDSEVQQI